MRIISGAFRGRHLAAVGKGDAGAHLRPTSDRVRESLFNVLSHLDVIDNAIVLDLFAGTGALGLEALSRGAQHVTFVENGRVGQGLIRQNIALTKSGDRTRLIRRDATRLGLGDISANLVFLDPPYGQNLGQRALHAARDGGWLATGAMIVFEDNLSAGPVDGFEAEDERRYGETRITFLRFVDSASL